MLFGSSPPQRQPDSQSVTGGNSERFTKKENKGMMIPFILLFHFLQIVKMAKLTTLLPYTSLHIYILHTAGDFTFNISLVIILLWSPVRAHIKIKEVSSFISNIPTFDTLLVSTNCIFINPSLTFNDYIQPEIVL